MKIGIIGAGSWGTALGKHLAEHENCYVTIWCHESELVDAINHQHENHIYLEGIKLPDRLVATDSFEKATAEMDMMILVTPSHVFREILTEVAPLMPVGVPIISATKGIENGSLMLMSQILKELLPKIVHPFFCYLSGPSFAREVAEHKPTVLTVASYDRHLAHQVQHLFSTPVFRIYTSVDVIGVEVGGALKNVIAIASGAIAALDLGNNATAALVTRGLAEMTRLSIAMGGEAITMSGLAGLGDLVLTCTGELSRNRTLGYKLGEGKELAQVLGEMNMVAEGVKTSRSVHDLAQKMDVELPICEQVFQVIHEGKDCLQAVHEIMTRSLKTETHGIIPPAYDTLES